MKTTVFSELLCRYAADDCRQPADLSRALTPAERGVYQDLARQIGAQAVGLQQNPGAPLVVDMGTHLFAAQRIGQVKVAVQLDIHPEGGVTAGVFATQPNAPYPVRHEPDMSLDIGEARFDPATVSERPSVGDLAELRLIQAALYHAVPVPA